MRITRCRTHHLCDAEAVSEVVERHHIVVLEDPEQEASERVQLHREAFGEVEVDEHLLQQEQHLLLRPLPAVEGRRPQLLENLFTDIRLPGEEDGV